MQRAPDKKAPRAWWGLLVVALPPGLLIALLLIITTTASPAATEREIQQRICAGLELEHTVPDGGRVDCLSATYAIEIDWSPKWAEALGQSLYYAVETDKLPAVILICREKISVCFGHLRRILHTVTRWRLPVKVLMLNLHEIPAEEGVIK